MRWMLIPMICLLASCANKVTPTGGPKDAEPPKVRETTPEQGSTAVNSQKITITFDEYVQLKEASRQVLVSPPVFPKPVISAQGKIVKIEFEKLADSTTYVMDFGNAIVDVNEGNPISGYRFVFSTGLALDTLVVEGKAYDMTSGKPLKGAIAMLFDAQIPDSVMVLRTPNHFARCDENGRFRIEYVAQGAYRLVVLLEKTENYLLDEPNELAGFSSNIITLPTDSIQEVWASPQPPPALRVMSSSLIPPATLMTVFNTDARKAILTGLNVSIDHAARQYNLTGDTVNIYLDRTPDSLPVSLIILQDGAVLDTVSYNTRSSTKSGGNDQRLKPELLFDKYGDADTLLNWEFPTPVRSMDQLKFRLMMDTVEQVISYLSISSDSLSMKMSKPRMPGKYTLNLYAGALTDIYGRQTDSTLFVFEIPTEKSRGAIRCKFKNPPAPNDIVQLLDDQSEMVRSMKASTEMVFQSLPPGKYRIRLLKDLNGNGIWDIGNIRKSLMPEPLFYHVGEITVRGNWDVDVEITF